MRGNPSGNFVPECEPRKGVSWRLTELDAKSDRDDSADSSDTQSLVLGSIFIPNRPALSKGGIKKVIRRAQLDVGGCGLLGAGWGLSEGTL